jgi:3-hydroxyisobutyrate dehydrogenase
MQKITILGLGAMGSRIAQNVLEAGYPVTVYNRTPERAANLQSAGARIAATPREAAEGADIVISMVRDDAASRALWLAEGTGAIQGVGPTTIAIESSTVTPRWINELAAQIRAAGAAFLEAPVLGTRPQADARQLTYLLGGKPDLIERVQAVLATTSQALHHIGDVGMAAAMKLAVNTQYSVQVAIWAETLGFLDKQGIAPTQAVAVLNGLPTTSPALQVAGKLMAAQAYTPMFPIELVEKDLGYALDVARSLALKTPTLEAVHAVYAEAIAHGYGNANIVGVKQLFDEMPTVANYAGSSMPV